MNDAVLGTIFFNRMRKTLWHINTNKNVKFTNYGQKGANFGMRCRTRVLKLQAQIQHLQRSNLAAETQF